MKKRGQSAESRAHTNERVAFLRIRIAKAPGISSNSCSSCLSVVGPWPGSDWLAGQFEGGRGFGMNRRMKGFVSLSRRLHTADIAYTQDTGSQPRSREITCI